jgi:hypothetical protein
MGDDSTRVLHWLPEEDRWVEIDWDDFAAFREFLTPFRPLPGVAGGVHYFVVCICGDGQTYNIIPHKYLVEPNGKIGRDNFYGWNREEREDFNRLMLAREFKADEEARLRAIQEKGGPAMYPPRESLYPLVRALPFPPGKNTAVIRFLDAVAAGKSRSQLADQRQVVAARHFSVCNQQKGSRRSGTTCQLTVSEFVAIILLDRETLRSNHHIDSSLENGARPTWRTQSTKCLMAPFTIERGTSVHGCQPAVSDREREQIFDMFNCHPAQQSDVSNKSGGVDRRQWSASGVTDMVNREMDPRSSQLRRSQHATVFSARRMCDNSAERTEAETRQHGSADGHRSRRQQTQAGENLNRSNAQPKRSAESEFIERLHHDTQTRNLGDARCSNSHSHRNLQHDSCGVRHDRDRPIAGGTISGPANDRSEGRSTSSRVTCSTAASPPWRNCVIASIGILL